MRTIGLEEVTKKINMREARIEAKRRWGNFASVRKDYYKRDLPFWVGKFIGDSFVLYGRGNSWEEAFDEATSKGH